MIVKFRIISGEKDDFVRDIELYSESSFLDLHLSIQDSCGYDEGLLTSFFVSDNDWKKGKEIILEKMDPETQQDVLLMEDVIISDFATDKKQKFIYVFDFFSVRSFFIEVVNIRKSDKEDKKLKYPICTLSEGTPPRQIFIEDMKNLDVDSPDFVSIDDLDDMSFDDDYDDDDGFDDDYNL